MAAIHDQPSNNCFVKKHKNAKLTQMKMQKQRNLLCFCMRFAYHFCTYENFYPSAIFAVRLPFAFLFAFEHILAPCIYGWHARLSNTAPLLIQRRSNLLPGTSLAHPECSSPPPLQTRWNMVFWTQT